MDRNKHTPNKKSFGPGPRMGGGEKPKNFGSSLKKLALYSKKYWYIIVVALVAAMCGTILTLVGPDKLSELTDLITSGILTGIDMDGVFKIGVTLVGIYALSTVLSLFQGIVMSTVTQRISKKLRTDISQKINKLPMDYYNKTTTGDVLSRVTNDVDTISQSLNQSVGTLVSAITLFFGSLFMMLITNVTMTIAAILSTFIGFGLMMFIMSKSQKYFSRQQKHLGAINGHIEEIYSGHNVVKAYNAQEISKSTFQEMNEKLRDSAFRAQCMSGLMMPLMSFIGNFGYVIVCIVGAVLAMNGTISFGVIVAFILYVRYFTQPLSQMAQASQNLQSATAASERVFEFLEAEEMEDESNKAGFEQQSKGYVEFDNVSFAYDVNEGMIIKNFTLEAKPGQKVAIVGPTGAGKTTLINLLMRFYEVNGGDIKIDGVSVKDMTREDVHAQFCMVLQDTWLFEGTLRENIVYCSENVTDEDIKRACKAVGLDHFVRTLPQGYNTILNEQVSLSSGQKQQLTIARAMIANRPMLILDEATSSVDTRTEVQIQNAMDQIMQNRTSFIIAHRLSTIKNADVILVMKDGEIIEQGSHDVLIEKNGFYSELYNSQFETN